MALILVTGASGRIGSELVRILTGARVPVRVLIRDPAKALRLAAGGPGGVDAVIGDMKDPLVLRAAMRGVDQVFLLSKEEPAQVELQRNVLIAALEARVRRVVKVSAMGVGADSPLREARWHHRTEQEIEDAGIAFTHLRPNYFMQNLSIYLRRPFDGVLRAPMGECLISMIDHRDVAAVAAVVLTGAGHDGQAYTLTGPEALSFAEVARRLSVVFGRQVSYLDVPIDAAHAEWLARGLSAWRADSFADLHREYRSNWAAPVTTTVAQLTGRPARTLENAARWIAT